MERITVSAVISHYEQHDLLARCLASLFSQSTTINEIIIVDDRSELIPSVESNHSETKIQMLQTEKNTGSPARPRNMGVEHCTTTHLFFVDADDILLPDTVGALKTTWERCPDAIAYGNQIEWGESVAHPYSQRTLDEIPTDTVHKRLLWGGNKICLSGTGGPTNIFRNEQFDESQRWEDYDLWLRLSKNRTPFRHTGHIHTLHQRRDGSRSGSRRARREGCKGIEKKHMTGLPWWYRPTWFWKQRLV
jgi:glycosyltransferase involved in cell wall biosynthesis